MIWAAVARVLDVVDRRRLSEVSDLDGERRPVSGLAAFPFRGFKQSRFFSADIGSGAELDLDVEIESFDAGDGFAEDVFLAEIRQDVLEMILQVGVFGADIENALLGAHRVAGDGHAFEKEGGGSSVRMTRSLKVPGLALVGVADDIMGTALFLPAEFPLESGGEAGAAPAEKIRLFNLVDDAFWLEDRGFFDRCPGDEGSEKDGASFPDVVRDHWP